MEPTEEERLMEEFAYRGRRSNFYANWAGCLSGGVARMVANHESSPRLRRLMALQQYCGRMSYAETQQQLELYKRIQNVRRQMRRGAVTERV